MTMKLTIMVVAYGVALTAGLLAVTSADVIMDVTSEGEFKRNVRKHIRVVRPKATPERPADRCGEFEISSRKRPKKRA